MDSETGVYQKALDHWGEEAQICMGIEECNELSSELSRLYRGRTTDENVIEEIADVLIMAEQLSLVFGRDAVEAEKERKIARLNDRLEAAR